MVVKTLTTLAMEKYIFILKNINEFYYMESLFFKKFKFIMCQTCKHTIDGVLPY